MDKGVGVMDAYEGAALVVVGVLVFLVGMLVGVVTTNGIWLGDCENIHAHLSNGKVYECRLKESK